VRYQQDLQVALRDRLARLLTSNAYDAPSRIRYTVDWIRKQPPLQAILTVAERAENSLPEDFGRWKESVAAGVPAAAETEAGSAWRVWCFLEEIAEADRNGVHDPLCDYLHGNYGREETDAVRNLFQRVVTPLFDYLSEQVTRSSTMLYHLERYVRRLEWFEQDALYAQYQEVSAQKGEEVYDTDFRRFLFGEGVNMPYSQTKSPSGLSDAIVEVDDEDCFIGEIKLFDGENRGKRELGKGLNQAIEYAHDWGTPSGYLVIVNLSGRVLELPTDGPKEAWPPYLDIGNVRVYMIVARGLPRKSASKQGKPQPVVVKREDLLHPDGAD
jgi:hypothetical protein